MTGDTETRFYNVLGNSMACRETGSGQPVVFLHGNPTSSYLWRNVMPEVAAEARCLAPDLIGMGESQKLADPTASSYRFGEHRRYLDALLEQLELGDAVTLVLHDWGSALGFDWARRHPERVRGLVYMEALVRPLTWQEWPEAGRSLFQAFRSAAGENLVLEKNTFVERVLPGSIVRNLSAEEMAAYRAPFAAAGADRLPTLTWPRELPIDGEPADVVAIVSDYAAWLARYLGTHGVTDIILYGDARPEQALEPIFLRYVHTGAAPLWVRRFCETVLDLANEGRLDPRRFGARALRTRPLARMTGWKLLALTVGAAAFMYRLFLRRPG